MPNTILGTKIHTGPWTFGYNIGGKGDAEAIENVMIPVLVMSVEAWD